jgi:hypothetical protein
MTDRAVQGAPTRYGLDRDKARGVLSELIAPGEWPQVLERLAECVVPDRR